jgi:hypothetical protein
MMSPLQLKNNDELYRYLLSLAHELKHKGKGDVSNAVALASRFAFGSPSEFLQEARTALASVRAKCNDILTTSQLEDLETVLQQINTSFQRIGGA